jgi:hypothetical protein
MHGSLVLCVFVLFDLCYISHIGKCCVEGADNSINTRPPRDRTGDMVGQGIRYDKKVTFKPFGSRLGGHHCDADEVKGIFGRLDANTVAVAVSEPLNELVSFNTEEKMATFRKAARAALEYCGRESTPDQLEFIKAKKPCISETVEKLGRDRVSNIVEVDTDEKEDEEEEEEKTPTTATQPVIPQRLDPPSLLRPEESRTPPPSSSSEPRTSPPSSEKKRRRSELEEVKAGQDEVERLSAEVEEVKGAEP